MTRSTPLGIVGVGHAVPGRPVRNDRLLARVGVGADPDLLAGLPRHRHHVRPGVRAAAMAESAATPMLERLDVAPADIDLLLTNVLMPDNPITGCGSELASLLGCAPPWVLDVHNGGCASFPFMLSIAQQLADAGAIRSALVCNVQNTAGQVFSQDGVSRSSSALAAGDGCGVAYLEVGAGSPVLATSVVHDPQSAHDMGLAVEGGRRWWETRDAPVTIDFDRSKTAEIVARGRAMVPAAARGACDAAGVDVDEIDRLITNQPNRLFMGSWRDALGVDAARHLETFDRFGNLYGAGIPVSLSAAARAGALDAGHTLVLSGFAHAGDFAAAAVVRWHGGSGGWPAPTAAG